MDLTYNKYIKKKKKNKPEQLFSFCSDWLMKGQKNLRDGKVR